jgi:anti-sigma B factor antagonist
MKLEKKQFGDVVLLKFVGEFDTFNLPMFGERVDRMIDSGNVLFILDVRLLTFINSTALGYLIRMSKRVKEAGGEVVLARPSKFLKKTLSTLGLEAVFPVYESEEDALVYLRKGAEVGKMDLAGAEQDEALHGAVPILFRKVETDETGEFPPNQVGRIVNLFADGLLFRYQVSGESDPVEGSLAEGAKLKLKFRQPFAVKDHYFEMDADIADIKTSDDDDAGHVLTVRMTYDKVKDEDRKLLDQFVSDTQTWRKEVHGE